VDVERGFYATFMGELRAGALADDHARLTVPDAPNARIEAATTSAKDRLLDGFAMLRLYRVERRREPDRWAEERTEVHSYFDVAGGNPDPDRRSVTRVERRVPGEWGPWRVVEEVV
jgi:hypothetical protein